MESRHGVRQINMGGGRGEKSHNIHCENYDDGDTNYDDNEGYPAKYHHHKLP